MSSDIDFVSDKSAKDNSESFQIVSHASAHKMHRSAVRPFFCCGSQLSLVSMNDIIPSMAISEITELSDNDEDLELMVTEVKGYRKNFNLKRSKKTDLEKTPRKRFWSKVVKSQKTRPKLEKEVCTCTSFKKKDDKTNFLASSTILPHSSESSLSPVSTSSKSLDEASALASAVQNEHLHLHPNHHLLDFEDMYPSEDVDERRREERAREMEQGVSLDVNEIVDNVVTPHLRQCLISDSMSHLLDTNELFSSLLLDRDEVYEDEHRDHRYSLEVNIPVPVPVDTSKSRPVFMPSHSQVDYMHCLVPDIQEITNCSFYWGIMDRYQAEKLLENKPEGTFLLRDSAQEEFLFSVSFRRYGRSLHARIEQWNHKFSFDSHDPGVFASDTVCGLIEHYKDPSCCMFFEPMLISPLMRNFTFSLQHMCRAAICKNLNYDGINQLPLPRSLREYLQFYHYRQKIRVRRFDTQA